MDGKPAQTRDSTLIMANAPEDGVLAPPMNNWTEPYFVHTNSMPLSSNFVFLGFRTRLFQLAVTSIHSIGYEEVSSFPILLHRALFPQF